MQIKIFIPKRDEKLVMENNQRPSEFYTTIPDNYNRNELIEIFISQETYNTWMSRKRTVLND